MRQSITLQSEEHHFAKFALGIIKIFHEVLISMKFYKRNFRLKV